jgi:hypothetical protein
VASVECNVAIWLRDERRPVDFKMAARVKKGLIWLKNARAIFFDFKMPCLWQARRSMRGAVLAPNPYD